VQEIWKSARYAKVAVPMETRWSDR